MDNNVDINLRQNLADAHGILAFLGWDDHTYTHLSARIPGQQAFYLTPFGLCFEEVGAKDLLIVAYDGSLLAGAGALVNQTGSVIHSAIYENAPDLNVIFHLHTPESVAVSALVQGLLPLSQWALHFYDRLSYHVYDSLALSPEQGQALARDLSKNRVLFLRHHGIITTGKTLQEALFYTYHLQRACETQCKLLAMNQDYVTIPPGVCQRTVADLLSFEDDLGARDWQAWKRRLNRFQERGHERKLVS